jgi:hypothetical protein
MGLESDTKLAILLILCLIISLPFAITSILMGILSPGECDHTVTAIGLNVSEYLLGSGIAALILIVLSIMTLSCMFTNDKSSECRICNVALTITINIISMIMGMIWFIIGAIILFRGNIDCIRAKSIHVIYALILWSVSAIKIINLYYNRNNPCCIIISIP